MKLSIIIPVHNENATLVTLLSSIDTLVLAVEKEVIVVDDGSTDGSLEIIKNTRRVLVISHHQRLGKGAAIKSGLSIATGEIILFMDADLEYLVEECGDVIDPIVSGFADVVYGSRFIGTRHRLFLLHSALANRLLSACTRSLTGIPITDMETGYKAFRADILKKISIKENGFGVEPEITMKLSRFFGVRYTEVPITFHGRSIKNGKKVRWWDGIWAIWCIVKYGFVSKYVDWH